MSEYDMTESDERTRAYLLEMIEVGKKHGLSLGHEDEHGNFVVETRSRGERQNDEWLLGAFSRLGRL